VNQSGRGLKGLMRKEPIQADGHAHATTDNHNHHCNDTRNGIGVLAFPMKMKIQEARRTSSTVTDDDDDDDDKVNDLVVLGTDGSLRWWPSLTTTVQLTI
jgi:hypothetical protein